jgi:hypothetical protein
MVGHALKNLAILLLIAPSVSLSTSKTTDSASSTTGALLSAGGLGVQKKASVGSDLSVAGNFISASPTVSTTSLTGAIRTAGGLGVQLNANIGANFGVGGATALGGNTLVTGTLGVSAAVSITGNIVSSATTASTGSSVGAITTAGGLGVQLAAHFGSTANFGGVVTATSYVESSDANYKREIQTVSNALEKIQQVRGVNYFFRNVDFPDEGFPTVLQSGFIAQEVEEVMPEAVSTDSKTGMKKMSYKSVTPYLLEAVKEQQRQIQEQQRQIQELQAHVRQLLVLAGSSSGGGGGGSASV